MGKTGPKLLLMTNTHLHMRFRLVPKSVTFQCCRQKFRKWGQNCYIVLFSPLSPFHWPQNTWPWITLNGHFMLNSIFPQVHLEFLRGCFENNCAKNNKGKPILSAARMFSMDCSFWWHGLCRYSQGSLNFCVNFCYSYLCLCPHTVYAILLILQITIPVWTVENHGNTEIMETVIFVKGRDFARMLCFAVFFAEMPWFYVFYKNTLFLISISWSSLYDFNKKIITFVFASATKVRMLC